MHAVMLQEHLEISFLHDDNLTVVLSSCHCNVSLWHTELITCALGSSQSCSSQEHAVQSLWSTDFLCRLPTEEVFHQYSLLH